MSIAHRALIGHQLDEISSEDFPPKAPDKIASMTDGTDPATIVVSRKTLGWVGAAILAVFSGGQVASLRLVDDAPDPQTVALSARVDQLSVKMDQLSADGETRDARFTKILNAVLVYFLESERFQRELRQPNSPPRSEELERASQRLRDLVEH